MFVFAMMFVKWLLIWGVPDFSGSTEHCCETLQWHCDLHSYGQPYPYSGFGRKIAPFATTDKKEKLHRGECVGFSEWLSIPSSC